MRLSLTFAILCISSLAVAANAQEADCTELTKRIEKIETTLADIANQLAEIQNAFAPASPSQETIELLTTAEEELARQLKAKEEVYAEFRGHAPLMWRDNAGTNLHVQRQVEIDRKRSELPVSAEAIESDLASIRKYEESGDEAAALRRLVMYLLRNPKMASAYADVNVDTDLESAELLKLFKTSRTAELEALRRKTMELDNLYHQEQLAAQKLLQHVEQDKSYQQDIKRTQELLDAVVARLTTVNIRPGKDRERNETTQN